eukprot:TRINITY_DN17354_c0_g1_i1.p1 TRINITY_DN17354_c0_g1~~TRINITY_DN17354_c0_g1_i1.p1  ORF type:complete len:764 (+),score=135.41 TRINITY_DN17354_c0_g1_i1:36-2327(+)
MSSQQGVLSNFAEDEVLRQFLDPSFVPTTYTRSVIKTASNTPNARETLTQSIKKLDDELIVMVTNHYEELLVQVSNIKDLESILDVIKSGIDGLQESVQRIKNELAEPYINIKTKTQQLERVHIVSDLLRKIIRFLSLSSHLRRCINPSNGIRELPKAAQCLHEINLLQKEESLTGITVIDEEMNYILQSEQEILSQASRILIQGLETQNTTDIGNALQVYHNLNILDEKISSTTNVVMQKVLQSINVAIGANSLNEELKGITTNWKSRAAVFTRMEKMMDVLYSCCNQISLLQKVLGQKRILSQTSFTTSFWEKLWAQLSDQLLSATKISPIIETTFISDYPRLLLIFQNFFKRLQDSQQMLEDQSVLLTTLTKFENEYLSRSCSRVFDQINSMFPTNSKTPPKGDEIGNFIKLLSSEVDMASVDPRLLCSISKGISGGLKTFAAKVESMIATDQDSQKVLDRGTNPSQARNAGLYSSLQQVYNQTLDIFRNTPAQAQEAIAVSLKELVIKSEDILSPIFTEIQLILEKTILSLHDEDFNSQKTTESNYVKQLLSQIESFKNNILPQFAATTLLSGQLRTLVSRILVFYVRHVCLVRPLSEPGKMKLVNDIAHIELALNNLYSTNIKSLGPQYKMLKAVKPLLFMELDKFTAGKDGVNPELKPLAPSCVLHHLFSRGPPNLLSPHLIKSLSLPQYSHWIDCQTESQIWSLIKTCLDSYAHEVNLRGESHFSPVYPVMCEIGPSLLRSFLINETISSPPVSNK